MKAIILFSVVLYSAITFAGGSQGGGVGKMVVSFNGTSAWIGGRNDPSAKPPSGVFVYFVKADSSEVDFFLVSNLNGVVASKETSLSIDELSRYPAIESGLLMSKDLETFVKIF